MISAWAVYARLFQLARPFRWHLAGIVCLSVLSAPVALVAPVPLKIVVDHVLGAQPLPAWLLPLVPSSGGADVALVVALVMVVLVAAAAEAQTLASWVLQAHTTEHLLLQFRTQLFAHVQRLSMAYHDARGTSDAIHRIQYDAQAVQDLAVSGVVPFISAAVTVTAMVVVIARLDATLALLALGLVPLLFLLARRSSANLRDRWAVIKESDSRAMAIVQEVLGALRVVRAFGQEAREEARFAEHSHAAISAQVRLARTQGLFDAAVGVTVATGMAVALFVGASHARAGLLTAGNLVVVMAYLTQLVTPVQVLARRFGQLQRSVVGAARAFALLDEAPDLIERPDACALDRCQGNIRFEHVDFRYSGGRDVLRDVTVEVPAGTSVGIQGRSGVGKTTLINLLFRMHDPTRGAVTLDGVDLRDYRLNDLRRQFSLVLQEPVLFATTIAENIAYARSDATHEDIVAAAKAANAHDFISSLPDGYDTLVGERGMRLSGGERQRVSIARAFLKDAPILVLDEPTSAVDATTEALIIDAVRRLMVGRTTFMIAHRSSALDLCDVRLVLESGRVRAHATPLSLRSPWSLQPVPVRQARYLQEQTPYEPS